MAHQHRLQLVDMHHVRARRTQPQVLHVHGRARQRHPDVPAAALGGAALQRGHDTGRTQVGAEEIVQQVRGHQPGFAAVAAAALGQRDAGDGLRDLVETLALGPGPVTEGADRQVDKPRPQLGQRLRAEAQAVQAGGFPRLHEHVGAAHQFAQPGRVVGGTQVDVGVAFADAGVEQLQQRVGLQRRGHPQHFGAMLGQGARGHRAGDDVGRVDHPQVIQRAAAAARRLGRAVADLLDADHRRARQQRALRVPAPFPGAAGGNAGQAPGGKGFFEFGRLPQGHGPADGRRGVGAVQQLQRAVAQVRVRAGEVEPALVGGGVETRLEFALQAQRRHRVTVLPLEVVAAQAAGGVQRVDADALFLPAGARPALRGTGGGRAQRCGGGRHHAVGRAELGLLPAEGHGCGLQPAAAADAGQQFTQGLAGFGRKIGTVGHRVGGLGKQEGAQGERRGNRLLFDPFIEMSNTTYI